jgi:hypothetical protein
MQSAAKSIEQYPFHEQEPKCLSYLASNERPLVSGEKQWLLGRSTEARDENSRILCNRWRWRRRSVFTVLLLDVRPHFLETFPLIHHLHHVTRDAYADTSGEAHSIKLQISASRHVL